MTMNVNRMKQGDNPNLTRTCAAVDRFRHAG